MGYKSVLRLAGTIMLRTLAFISIVFVFLLVACVAEPASVEVTQVIGVTIEVTRPVEVIVEATDTLRDLFYRYDEMVVIVTRIVETELQADLGRTAVALLENDVEGIKQINLIRWSEGQLEIELITALTARDNQPAVSWDVVNALAGHFAPLTADQRLDLTGSEQFVFLLTTDSVVSEHCYHSETDYDTFVQLNDQAISLADWIAATKATFC